MTNENFQQTLLSIAHQLTLLATGDDGTSLPLDHPPGTTKVVPTGVLGAGKVRYWPEGLASVPPSGVPELFWSYCLRMTYVKRPDGEAYIPAIYRQQLGYWFVSGGPAPAQMAQYGAAADRWVYPEEWMTQEEIDAKLASDELWAADYRKKYGV
jgi:hypothetical protein